jgi:hypothetical protein
MGETPSKATEYFLARVAYEAKFRVWSAMNDEVENVLTDHAEYGLDTPMEEVDALRKRLMYLTPAGKELYDKSETYWTQYIGPERAALDALYKEFREETHAVYGEGTQQGLRRVELFFTAAVNLERARKLHDLNAPSVIVNKDVGMLIDRVFELALPLPTGSVRGITTDMVMLDELHDLNPHPAYAKAIEEMTGKDQDLYDMFESTPRVHDPVAPPVCSHKPEGHTLAYSGSDLIIDVSCSECGISGSFAVDTDDINW